MGTVFQHRSPSLFSNPRPGRESGPLLQGRALHHARSPIPSHVDDGRSITVNAPSHHDVGSLNPGAAATKSRRYTYQNAELTPVWVPTPEHEALRDLVRQRGAAKADESRAKHRLVKHLLRRGLREPNESRAWTHPWWRWVQSLKFDYEAQKAAFADCIAEVLHMGERLARLDKAIDQLVALAPPHMQAVIEALQALRGVAKLTAVTIVTEVGTFKRFRRPTQFMGYTGQVPSEHSSGARQSKGGITHAGNAHLRHVLGEAAWHARHRPWLNKRLKKLLPTLPAGVEAIAWKAQERLHKKFTKMTYRGKNAGTVATAVARELAGFVWAIGTLVESKQTADNKVQVA